MSEQLFGQETCRTVVEQLMARHGWSLLSASEFEERLRARVQAAGELDAAGIKGLAVNLYCEVWYAACRENGARRTPAYGELARYLYDQALYKMRDAEAAREVAQDALVLVAEQLPNCHNPGAFMAFALLKLWNASTAYFRARDLQARHTQAIPTGGDEDDGRDVPDPVAVLPEVAALESDLARRVVARCAELLRASPRGRKQIEAVLLKFLHEQSDEEIAHALGTDVPGVYVLRSRGLKRLREDAVLRGLFLTAASE